MQNLYIVPDNKEANDKTLQLATAIQAQRIVELQNDTHGFKSVCSRSKMNLVEYIKTIAEKKRIKAGGGNRGTFQNYLTLNSFKLFNFVNNYLYI